MAPNIAGVEDGGVPPTHFAQARGARIAYQDFGDGPTVVAVPPLAQNIEMAWELPEVRFMMERFGSFARWVQFDKRGTGASDRRSQVPGLDERVEDLRAVMDDAGIERALLYGASEGGPMCVLFALTYPERVDGLILHGTTALFQPPGLSDSEIEERNRRDQYMADVWGTPESIVGPLFSPSMADDPDYRKWLERYERLSADRASLLDLLGMLRSFDVREALPDLDVPTLVMHRSGDQVIPVKYGQELANQIKGAQFIEHEGIDHFGFAGDMGWLYDLERFVTGTVADHGDHQRPPGRSTKPTVRINTLGRFAVEVDGEEVPTSSWGSRLSRQLCKRLVAARGWPVTREELFDLLWPEEHDISKLGPRLSVQLSAVRRVLNGGVIADRQTVALNLDEVSTDLEDFFATDTDEAAVAAYTGDFLIEDVAEDWTAGARDEARSSFIRSARHVGTRSLEGGDFEQAGAMARRLIGVDRYDEDAHRLLVTSLVGSGETAEARRAHEAWVQALAEIDVTVPPFEQI